MRQERTVAESGLATSLVRGRTVQRSFACRVIAGASTGREIVVGARAIIAGADAACELAVDDRKVSRRHAELCGTPEGLRVRDLDSTNGVFVDGVRIKEAFVPDGGAIRIGETVIKVAGAAAPSIPPSKRTRFGGLVGESATMRELFAVLELASPTEATVLIQGESGSGKELVARAIHDHSPRAAGPFVVFDSSAVPEAMLESQLFGHVKGAFTGAAEQRRGAFVEATGGTLFIDEIGELPLASQGRLLRALEARTVQPLGSDKAVAVDVRVIAATHRDLSAMVAQKTFRFDLFHRLAVVHVMTPPLRDRLDDLPALIRFFFEGRKIDPGAIEGPNLDRLRAHGWRGNVRELRNVLDRAFVLMGDRKPAFQDLPIWLEPDRERPLAAVDTHLPFKEAKERWVGAFEREYLAAVYARFEGNITRGAEHAGLTRRHYRELLHNYGIKVPADDRE